MLGKLKDEDFAVLRGLFESEDEVPRKQLEKG